jgi:NAD(P)-dependent dehydrogenase (short-subunit alcohol dehydrogenase family)
MGRGHALRLAEEGADLVVADICRDVDGVRYPMARPQDLADTARAAEQLGARVVPVAVDVRDGERLATETARAADELGGLDAAVANAGVLVTGAWDSPSAGVATGIESDLDALLRTDRPDLAPVYTNALPVRRVEPIDVSNAVVYLVSDESRYVTGTQLKVDAGATIR